MVGTTALGKYRILRSLGRGSNAEVFLAQPLKYPNNRVVVKRVHDHVVSHPKFRQLFDAEVRSMANFRHPYAVRLLEASLDDPLGPCMVLEYVPGVTLEAVLAKHRRLPVERVARFAGFLCHALQAAHAAGIVHRDLKPSNLMVVDADNPGETLKVMDFGFAGFSAKPHIQLAELTGHGPMYAIGTPGYVSPEMIRGDTVDGRSDLYSVGVVLFELLTGRLPFEYDVMDKMLAAHVKEPPPRFHRIGSKDVPAVVEGIVQLALSKYPNERQQSAREVADGFSTYLGEDIWEATAPPGYEAARATPRVQHTPPPRQAPNLPSNPYHLNYDFEAIMPERMAAVKLRGFVEDLGGDVLGSEPGLIRLRVGVPPGYKDTTPAGTGSSLFGWLNTLRKPSVARGQEPIELELHMSKPDPFTPRLAVTVACRPLKDFPPKDVTLWRTRCDKLQAMLRQYLGT